MNNSFSSSEAKLTCLDLVDICVVIPVYQSAGTLRELHRRLVATLSALVGSYEIVFVDDRSRDGAWPIIRQLIAADPHVSGIRLSRNFGQHLAITAGLEESRGMFTVVMDCDLQDPPETIVGLFAEVGRGFDIVLARRKSIHQSRIRLLSNSVYFRILGAIAGQELDGELGTFSILSRRAVEAFLQFSEKDRHYLMVLNWIGFEKSTIEYTRDRREIGKSSYSWRSLLAHGASGLFFTTTRLLNWVVYTGIALAMASAAAAAYFVIQWYIRGAVPGWTSLIVVHLFVGGITIMCIGVTALYVGKIFEAAQHRPLYFVQDRVMARQPRPARARPQGEDGQDRI